jgi:hypothetical protein
VRESTHRPFYPLTLGDEVNFRLTYSGPLKAVSQSESRRLEKHAIRRALGRQLEKSFKDRDAIRKEFENERFGETQRAIRKYREGDWFFLPIVREELNLVCDLYILFIARDKPGSRESGGGEVNGSMSMFGSPVSAKCFPLAAFIAIFICNIPENRNTP